MIFHEEKGQITVFLSLVFFVILGASLVILEGMHGYLETSLAEEAFEEAGNYVLANYDKTLFHRYHIFFLDPREEKYIVSDGKEYMDQYLNESSFYGFSCRLLEVTKEQRAVDESGLYLKHQIREWMKYREAAKAGKALKSLIQSVGNQKKDEDGVTKDLDKVMEETDKEPAGSNEKSSSESNGTGSEGISEKEENTEKDTKEKICWKDLKETLQLIADAGILNYAVDNVQDISKLTVSESGLPSEEERSKKTESSRLFRDVSFSFTQVKEWKALLNMDASSEIDTKFLTDDFFISEYIFECFGNYEHELEGTALQYEIEYLLGGKPSDLKNIKYIANRILILRFLTNYISISQNMELKAKAETMAAVLTGFMGLPEAGKAVQTLLLAALSYGESLLEIHTLFSGDKIPVMKDASTWNLNFENAVSLLKERKLVKKGKINVGYEDYLKLLLAFQIKSKALYYKMMDVMQMNTALEEPGFTMKNCIFSFSWKGIMQCSKWFSLFQSFGNNLQNSSNTFEMELVRVNSY